MDELIRRFPHIAKQISEQLDNNSLAKCREVKKSWLQFIDEKSLPWIRIVEIPRILNFQNTYLHIAANRGQVAMFEYLFQNEAIKNPKHLEGTTPFHLACKYGHFKIAEMLINKFNELDTESRNLLELNSKDKFGHNGFHWACMKGHFKIVDMLLEKHAELKIDLNAKGDRETAEEIIYILQKGF